MDSLLPLAHFVTIGLAAVALLAEFVALGREPSPRQVRLLARIDIAYGLAVVAVVASGLARVFLGPIAPEVWAENPVFWAKMIAFGVVGALSAWPTVRFLAWSQKPDFTPSPEAWATLRRLVVAEIAVFVGIPLLAFAMV